MKQDQKNKKLAVAVAGLLVIGISSSFASLTFTSPSTTVGGASVNATAVISISGNTMTVTLTDSQANPTDVGQLLNGIQFDLAGVTGVSGLTASDATTMDIQSSDGSYSPMSTQGTSITSGGWNVSGASTITLTALGTANPQYLIIGPDANSNFTSGVNDPGYSNANGSINNPNHLGPHNPFILGQETFQFNLAGTGPFSEGSITNFSFRFGTSDDYANGTPTPVPEPSTVVAAALLLLPFGISTVRILRKRKQSLQSL